MKIKGGMLISPRDIELITGVSSTNTAQKEHLRVRDAIGRTNKRLTIKEYCEYWELDFEETVRFLNENR